MDGQTENLPILQDFIPYWGRHPKGEVTTKELKARDFLPKLFDIGKGDEFQTKEGLDFLID